MYRKNELLAIFDKGGQGGIDQERIVISILSPATVSLSRSKKRQLAPPTCSSLLLHARHQRDPLSFGIRIAIEEEEHVSLGGRVVDRRWALHTWRRNRRDQLVS